MGTGKGLLVSLFGADIKLVGERRWVPRQRLDWFQLPWPSRHTFKLMNSENISFNHFSYWLEYLNVFCLSIHYFYHGVHVPSSFSHQI